MKKRTYKRLKNRLYREIKARKQAEFILRKPIKNVQVVMCKDCRYAHGTITDVARCMKNKNRLNEYHPLNWYCADGEQRAEV